MYAQKLVLNDDTEEEKDKGTCAVIGVGTRGLPGTYAPPPQVL